jgi:hypothetical protein
MSWSSTRHRGRACSRIAIAVVFITLLTGLSASAQGFRRSPPDGGAAGFFGAGGARIDAAALDDELTATGYPTFGRQVLTIGGGGYGVHGSGILVGGEGYGVLTGDVPHQGRSVSLTGGFGLFNVGYMAPLTGRLRAYPLLGFGGGGTGLRIGAGPTSEPFRAFLLNPDRQTHLSRVSLLATVGGGIEFRSSRSSRGVLVGVRAGYMFAPVSSSWRLDGNVVGAAPDASLAGPFVRVLVGGGG